MCLLVSGSAITPSEVSYHAIVKNIYASCELVQQYDIIEDLEDVKYQFPVDYNSAFYDLTIITPRGEIKGVVKEKELAKKEFTKAKEEGKEVFMVSENNEDRDIYTLSMGKLLNGEKITIKLAYSTMLHINGSSVSFHIPTFISQRYGSTTYYDKPINPIKIKILFPQTNSVTVNTKNLTIQNTSGDIEVSGILTTITEDIEIKTSVEMSDKCHMFTSRGYTFASCTLTPKLRIDREREIVYVLDCSGSMEGERINNALRALCEAIKNSINCNVSVIYYGSNTKIVIKNTKVSDDNYINLIKICEKEETSMGGTETYRALELALTLAKRCILITDGDTSNNSSLHKLCESFESLCILGIGSGINRANIVDMTRRGHGIAVFNQGGGDTSIFVNDLLNTVTGLCVKNYDCKWSDKKYDLMENTVMNTPLFSRTPLITGNTATFYGMCEGDCGNIIDLTMNINNIEIKTRCELLNHEYDDMIANLIAKRIIVDSPKTDKLVKIAETFGIVTEYTSFIAIGDEVRDLQIVRKSELEDRIRLSRNMVCKRFDGVYDEEDVWHQMESLSSSPMSEGCSMPKRSVKMSAGRSSRTSISEKIIGNFQNLKSKFNSNKKLDEVDEFSSQKLYDEIVSYINTDNLDELIKNMKMDDLTLIEKIKSVKIIVSNNSNVLGKLKIIMKFANTKLIKDHYIKLLDVIYKKYNISQTSI